MYGANTNSPLRGDYSRARADFTVEQSWHPYTPVSYTHLTLPTIYSV